ncbi:hypothetical protein K0T92_16555 [Paenibacillus oenotherae]|uniref:Uncharacterized protein n=1 Tax=Paenibacillus oenotherae TaxID=1435645 RepID=A0ABS7D9U1_9BACL|nr:hypothetical protein [Paenibacillus oenotherae]MBW7476346.1 hypothetical protein [Paenibacillus oenotherae]
MHRSRGLQVHRRRGLRAYRRRIDRLGVVVISSYAMFDAETDWERLRLAHKPANRHAFPLDFGNFEEKPARKQAF